MFEDFSCRHIYKENNREVDPTSKEGLHLAMGQWKIREHRDGNTQEYFHIPFIDWHPFLFMLQHKILLQLVYSVIHVYIIQPYGFALK